MDQLKEIEIKKLVSSIQEGAPNAAERLTELCPRLDECRAIVQQPTDAKKLFMYVNDMYEDALDGLPIGNPNRTEILISSATTNQLKLGITLGLPIGYADIAYLFHNDLTIYGFKYVEPGMKTGMFYGGLIFIKGRWVFIPKMWRAFTKVKL